MEEVKFEVKVALSDWSEFERGDVVRVEVDGSEKFISIEKSDGSKERKYKVTGENIQSINTEGAQFLKIDKYDVVRVNSSLNDTGIIIFGSFFGRFSWFVINLNGIPLTPRSGSGGGLQK
ncbi:hypothetical protein [Cellvibrio sp.]